MTALAAERSTIRMDSSGQVIPDLMGLPIAANTVAYQGGIACINSAGYGVNGATALGLKCVGRWSLDVNATGMASGALNVNVDQGTFKYSNGTSADLISQANVGQLAWIIDDNTVGLTNGSNTRSPAGIIIQVDSDGGVWVQLGLGIGQVMPTQVGVVALTAGTKTINTGIAVTAGSTVLLTRKLQGGTVSSTILYEEIGGSRVVGPAGTGSITIQASVAAGTVNAADTSTLQYSIQG